MGCSFQEVQEDKLRWRFLITGEVLEGMVGLKSWWLRVERMKEVRVVMAFVVEGVMGEMEKVEELEVLMEVTDILDQVVLVVREVE